jgi:hypothetical protein
MLLFICSCDNETEEQVMSRLYSMHMRAAKYMHKLFLKNLKGRHHLEEVSTETDLE